MKFDDDDDLRLRWRFGAQMFVRQKFNIMQDMLCGYFSLWLDFSNIDSLSPKC